MNIRKSRLTDLEGILDIYMTARNFMRTHGNPNQWGDTYPSREQVAKDITDGISYVIEDEKGLHGCFVFFTGQEKNYDCIEDGEWVNDDKYGVIHRVAGDGVMGGVLKSIVSFCRSEISNIRIDTHHDNAVMRQALKKLGFKKCGTVYTEDGSKRLAYQLSDGSCGKIRHATMKDLDRLAYIEAASYPGAEAAGRESIRKRLESFPECFWILEEEGNIVSFINGMVTDSADLSDIMYEDAKLHNRNGRWQMIFSVVTAPEYRKHGYASYVMEGVIADCRRRGRGGIVLTCKDRLIPFYAGFGFKNEGVSGSAHGDAVWYQMRLVLRR